MAKDSAAASNQTAEKLLLVLEALARQTQPVKLVDLAHQVGMNQSTCYRFVAALQNAGYAAQDKESGKYILNLKLCSLAEMIKDRVSVTSLLHAFVAEASALFQESAHLVQEENRQIVYTPSPPGPPWPRPWISAGRTATPWTTRSASWGCGAWRPPSGTTQGGPWPASASAAPPPGSQTSSLPPSCPRFWTWRPGPPGRWAAPPPSTPPSQELGGAPAALGKIARNPRQFPAEGRK